MHATATYRPVRRAACALIVAIAGPAALAAGPDAAQAAYDHQRAYCASGQSQQDQATCLKEAGAALAEARRDGLKTPSPAAAEGNALDRCTGLPDPEQRDCIARMEGLGSTEGSVRGGGILRESRTIEVGPPVVLVPAPVPEAEPAAPQSAPAP